MKLIFKLSDGTEKQIDLNYVRGERGAPGNVVTPDGVSVKQDDNSFRLVFNWGDAVFESAPIELPVGLPGKDGGDGKDGVAGEKGEAGRDGVSISSILSKVDESDPFYVDVDIIVELTDGSQRSFSFKVKNGEKGEKGDKGEDGERGEKGDTGASGNLRLNQHTDINAIQFKIRGFTLINTSDNTLVAVYGSREDVIKPNEEYMLTNDDYSIVSSGSQLVLVVQKDIEEAVLLLLNEGQRGPKGDKGDAGQPGAEGIRGPKGEKGTSIIAVEADLLSTQVVDDTTTNTISLENIFSDAPTQKTTFKVVAKNGSPGLAGPAGAPGKDGIGIANIYKESEREEAGYTTTNIRGVWENGRTSSVVSIRAKNGDKGDKGDKGDPGSSGGGSGSSAWEELVFEESTKSATYRNLIVFSSFPSRITMLQPGICSVQDSCIRRNFSAKAGSSYRVSPHCVLGFPTFGLYFVCIFGTDRVLLQRIPAFSVNDEDVFKEFLRVNALIGVGTPSGGEVLAVSKTDPRVVECINLPRSIADAPQAVSVSNLKSVNSSMGGKLLMVNKVSPDKIEYVDFPEIPDKGTGGGGEGGSGGATPKNVFIGGVPLKGSISFEDDTGLTVFTVKDGAVSGGRSSIGSDVGSFVCSITRVDGNTMKNMVKPAVFDLGDVVTAIFDVSYMIIVELWHCGVANQGTIKYRITCPPGKSGEVVKS